MSSESASLFSIDRSATPSTDPVKYTWKIRVDQFQFRKATLSSSNRSWSIIIIIIIIIILLNLLLLLFKKFYYYYCYYYFLNFTPSGV